jgi:hypothetical protein|tara:strand:+ start:387 stop:1358 length:972 start_codon:yes stop_codon:yes gene_type:complete
MANYTTSADLLDDALDRAGEATDGTSDFNAAAIRFLNRAYQGIWSGGSELDPDIREAWWWLRKDDQGILILNPMINDGSVDVTNNSASITFSTGPTPSVAGRHFKVNDHSDVFIISAHTAGETGATLESVYTGDTDTAASYRVMQIDYDLADSYTDILYLSSPMIAYKSDRGEVQYIDLHEMRRKYPLNRLDSGVPHDFSLLSSTKIRFSHYGGTSSTELIKLDFEYMRMPADLADDASEPIVPRQYRKILADWTLALLLDEKDDSRGAAAIALAQRGLRAMSNEHRATMRRMGRSFGHVFPRQTHLERFIGPLRTETGLIVG